MTSARITALAAALSAPLRALSPLDRDVLGWWILTRLGLLLIGSTAPYLFGDGAPPPTLDRWRQWDFWHFDRIATHGYFEPGWRDPVEAFFPGLPLLLRAGFALGAPTVVIGLVKRNESNPQHDFDQEDRTLAYWEPNIQNNGHTGTALIVPKAKVSFIPNDAKQFLLSTHIQNGKHFVYYNGATWDKAGKITSADAWEDYVEDKAEQLKKPLKVKLR